MAKNFSWTWASFVFVAIGCGGKVSGSNDPAATASAPAASAASGSSAAGPGTTPPASIPAYGSVRILNLDGDRPACAGVFLRDDLVLTARHCVSDVPDDGTGRCSFGELLPADSFQLRFEAGGGTPGFGRVHAIEVEETTSCTSDIALLHVFGSTPASLKPMTSRTVPAPGDVLYVDQKPVVTRAAAGDATQFELDSPYCLGESGKGIIDGSGRLAGIVVGGGPLDRTKCSSTLYALPVAPHLPFLQRALGG